MMKFLIISAMFVSSASFAQDQKTEDYCKRLHEARGGFLDLAPPGKEDENVTPFTKKGMEAKMTAEAVRAEASKKKVKMNGAELAQYRRDFYFANCQKIIEAQKEYDKIPFEVRYCATLRPVAEQADNFASNQKNIENNYAELRSLSSAVYKDMTTEALDNKLSFEDYAKKVSVTSKIKGKEIVLGDYARAQYTSAFYQRYCVTDTAALTRHKAVLTSGSGAKQNANFGLPDFQPFEASAVGGAK